MGGDEGTPRVRWGRSAFGRCRARAGSRPGSYPAAPSVSPSSPMVSASVTRGRGSAVSHGGQGADDRHRFRSTNGSQAISPTDSMKSYDREPERHGRRRPAGTRTCRRRRQQSSGWRQASTTRSEALAREGAGILPTGVAHPDVQNAIAPAGPRSGLAAGRELLQHVESALGAPPRRRALAHRSRGRRARASRLGEGIHDRQGHVLRLRGSTIRPRARDDA